MDVSQWQRVKDIFSSALEREPAQRSAFLAEACGEDGALRQEVESLLASHQEPPDRHGADTGSGAEANQTDQDSFSGRRVGPYQVVRRIGQGGMATVYLAVRADEHYKKHVAIKIVPPGLDSQELIRRFRNERQTLAALDHPNIVRLLDGGTTEDGLPYLVMDYVEGSPLDEYSDNHLLSTDERLRLFLNVCAAVQYAHQRLVIHRDLKPGNILVTADGTVKLLDFGIAKLLSPEAAATLVVTRTGQRAMTPEYASPEQVRGEPLTNATDVYSLGVVLYELVTGHQLLSSAFSIVEMERAICDLEPIRPSTVVTKEVQKFSPDRTTRTITPDEISRRHNEINAGRLSNRLHGDLDAIVMTALRKEPQRRYGAVYEFSEDIGRHLKSLPVKARPSSVIYYGTKFLQRHKEATAAILIFAILLAATGTWYAVSRVRVSSYHIAQIKGRRSVAVLGFRNLSGRADANWLSMALSEMLTTELAAGEELRTVPGENVARMKIDLSLPESISLAPDTVAKIHQNLGSDLLVMGSYLDLAGQVRLDVRLQDATNGEILEAVTEDGAETDLSQLVSKTGGTLRQKLDLGRVTREEMTLVKASLPSDKEAARLYAEGLARLRVFDALEARRLLEESVSRDPSFALAHTALAKAWSSLGYDEKAKEEAKHALDLSNTLSREERLLVEGRFREMTKEWPRAIEIYHTLFDSFPDNLEYGLQLASAQTQAQRGSDTQSTIGILRNLPEPARDDPKIDLAEADAAHSQSDFKREEAAARKAERKAREHGSKLLLAPALMREGAGLQGQNQYRDATAALEGARQVLSDAGDRDGAAYATLRLGEVLNDQGNLSESQKAEQQALVTFREIGDIKREAMALFDIGNIIRLQGGLFEAKKDYEQALTVFRAIGQKSLEALTTNAIGLIQWAQGDLSDAENAFRQSLAVSKEAGNPYVTALVLINLADILLERGDLNGARLAYEESAGIAERIGNKDESASAKVGLGDILKNEGDLERARLQYEKALESGSSRGELAAVARIQVALADLAIEEGRFVDAAMLAKTALQEFRKEKVQAGEIAAVEVLSRALLAQGRSSEAKRIIADAKLIMADRLDTLLPFAIAAAKVQTANGGATMALADVRKTVSQAQQHGFIRTGMDARLTLAEIEVKSGQTALGRLHLEALQKEADAKGFRLIAHKAAEAAQGAAAAK